LTKEVVMRVRDVYTRNVVSASPAEDLEVAASRMDYNGLGCLAVMSGTSLVGLLTERDVLRAVAEGRELRDAVVQEYMTSDVVTVEPDAGVAQAAALMITVGCRHLPVRERGAIVGVVSARDLLAVEGWGELVAAALKDTLPLEAS
jgi:CBS domain-containing protein